VLTTASAGGGGRRAHSGARAAALGSGRPINPSNSGGDTEGGADDPADVVLLGEALAELERVWGGPIPRGGWTVARDVQGVSGLHVCTDFVDQTEVEALRTVIGAHRRWERGTHAPAFRTSELASIVEVIDFVGGTEGAGAGGAGMAENSKAGRAAAGGAAGRAGGGGAEEFVGGGAERAVGCSAGKGGARKTERAGGYARLAAIGSGGAAGGGPVWPLDASRARVMSLLEARLRHVFNSSSVGLWSSSPSVQALQLTRVGAYGSISSHFNARDVWAEGIATICWSELPVEGEMRGESTTLRMERGRSRSPR
jgi:hypothetical protein